MTKIAKAIIIAAKDEVISTKEVASDMMILIGELKGMPPGQYKKIVANDKIKSIFKKYGVPMQ